MELQENSFYFRRYSVLFFIDPENVSWQIVFL